MRRTQGACIVESLCVKGKTKGSLNTRTKCLSVTYIENAMSDSIKSKARGIPTKSKDTSIVNFSLDESSRVKVTGIMVPA